MGKVEIVILEIYSEVISFIEDKSLLPPQAIKANVKATVRARTEISFTFFMVYHLARFDGFLGFVSCII